MNKKIIIPSGLKSIFKYNFPASWEKKRLDSLASIIYGISTPLDRSLKNGIKIISLPNVSKDGKFIDEDVPYVDKTKVKKDLILKYGDILFNWRNGSKQHLGKTIFFNLEGKYTHVGFLLKITAKPDKSDSLYLYYYINFQ